ncbi:hypothetical protein L6164_016745 [Bauhinia variegata]|uniref:Uncharacterized protein n=1 Tax=Bauhinia variegata TaxID=167791 RepID=A0ACB9NAT6_BAUVA|nr:hypothetical protein L6164_016745 [Bauhinia variegata]
MKIGVPLMLLRNIDQYSGMCNGIRLVVTKMGGYVLEAEVISESNVVFSHGQSYHSRLELLLHDDEGNDTNITSNVVYKEVFKNLSKVSDAAFFVKFISEIHLF